MGELTRLRVFELTKTKDEQYPVTVDFSDVISAYDKDASITAVTVNAVPAAVPGIGSPLILGYQIPAGSQKVILGLGKGLPGIRYEVNILVTTTIQIPGSTEFSSFSAVVYVTVKG